MNPRDYFCISLAFFTALLLTLIVGALFLPSYYVGTVVGGGEEYHIFVDTVAVTNAIAILSFLLSAGFAVAGIFNYFVVLLRKHASQPPL